MTWPGRFPAPASTNRATKATASVAPGTTSPRADIAIAGFRQIRHYSAFQFARVGSRAPRRGRPLHWRLYDLAAVPGISGSRPYAGVAASAANATFMRYCARRASANNVLVSLLSWRSVLQR
ncbi:hypothetical protein KCP73_22490 [Salmonella enterica subsp. enterica]|nr:hypothetical protein KCP73_22490 [Salmonella enterica subsp. enterica]